MSRVRDRIECELLRDEESGTPRTADQIAEATGASVSWVKTIRDDFRRGRDARAAERAEESLFSWHDVIGPELRRLPPAWRVAVFAIGALLNRVSDRTPVGPQNERAFEEMLDAIASGVDEGVRDEIVRAVVAALPVAGQPDTSHSQVAGAARERE
jgi:hypothetical protein